MKVRIRSSYSSITIPRCFETLIRLLFPGRAAAMSLRLSHRAQGVGIRSPRLWSAVARALILLASGIALWSWSARSVNQAAPQRSFAADVVRLSEAGGDFDTDNLVSNERSYLDVIPALRQAGVSGGAYVGVGPDQNFSYIANVRPEVAFILDVRRDNLLL